MEILKSFSMFTLKPTSAVSDYSILIFEKCGLSNTFPQTTKNANLKNFVQRGFFLKKMNNNCFHELSASINSYI